MPEIPELTIVTQPLDEPPADLGAALPFGYPADRVCSWVRRGEGLIGWGQAARFEAHGPDRFARAGAWWQGVRDRARVTDKVGLAGCGAVAFASFAFSADSASASVVVVPQVLIGHRGGVWWRTEVTGRAPASPAVIPGTGGAGIPPRSRAHVAFSDGDITSAQYAGHVADAVRRIESGALDKVVLARDLVATAQRPIDAAAVLAALRERYPMTWTFAVDGLVGATPELLVRRERGLVTSRVLAGTIRRTGDDAHDLALAGSLARSSKDLEEHEYAVNSVANALAPHCSSMNVPDSPSVLHLPNVMHLATDVTGVCVNGIGVLELAAALHPSAAVGGTPRETALAVIGELEHMDRRRYAGPVGWMNGNGDGEFGIALRCGQIEPTDPCTVRLYAGGGIVAGSVPEDEVAESLAKLVPMRDALSALA